MTVVHIIDDMPTFRERLDEKLTASWKDRRAAEGRELKTCADWRYVWSLTEALENNNVALTKEDIIISDLYSAGFWDGVPQPVESPVSQFPDDPENLRRATLEVVNRFFPKLQVTHAHLIVLTFVPHFVEDECGRPELAKEMREQLERNDRILVEKQDRDVDNDANYRPTIELVNKLIGI